ncbi:MAG: YbaY family lipoprotein [Planctomycetaceae bacterium]|nr:YbaY family lipoprotein [Planctomycetaceae bacterium]
MSARKTTAFAAMGFALIAGLSTAVAPLTGQDLNSRLGLAIAPGIGWGQGQQWQLGVQVQNTTTGVVLTQVLPGSPAANGGLRVGDRILAVGGHQVGYVDGRLVDLGDEINQHIGPNGQITLLVFNAQQGQVQSGPLTLTSTGGNLQGTAVVQGGSVRLSRQAMMTVQMRDTSHNHWTGVVVAQTSVRAWRSPISFQLAYNPTQVYPGHRYAIDAEITDQGRVVYRTNTPAVFVPGAGNNAITLVLTPAAIQVPGVGVPGTGIPGVGVLPGGGGVYFPYDQVNGWYQSYLGRQPTAQELQSWQQHVQQGRPVNDIQAYLLGSSEYYDRQRNDPNQYLRGVYQSLRGREPTPQQLQDWRQQYDRTGGVRSRFVQQQLQTQGR